MKPKHLLGLFFLLLISVALKEDKRAFCLYNEKGKMSNYKKMLESAEKADIVLFGELHNNSIAHWMQLQLVKDLHKRKGQELILGAEMFESDNQELMNEYLKGLHSSKTFEKESKLWNNYKTDYKPLVEFAKENSLHFVASNVPRRYANLVYRKGLSALDSLSDQAKEWLPPLPIQYDSSLACYSNILKMAGGHGGQNLPKSQALKDATMAHFIYKNFKQGSTFVHFNGSYHSNNFESIYWYLKKLDPNLKISTINAVEQSDISSLDSTNRGTANFIIAIPDDMTKTY